MWGCSCSPIINERNLEPAKQKNCFWQKIITYIRKAYLKIKRKSYDENQKAGIMKRNWKALVVSILIPLAVGTIAGLLTMGGMQQFAVLNKPPLSPPAWLFPVVWTILYILMGISSYLIYVSGEKKQKNGNQGTDSSKGKKESGNTKENTGREQALTTYGYQLIVNFLWPVFFFNFQWYFFAFLWLVLLWILVAKMILEFGEISKAAALMNIPYLLWLSFAGYLNLGIWLLN